MESFERKLEEAQKALNIDPRDYVPVLYIDETDHAKELLRILPVMAFIGTVMKLKHAQYLLNTTFYLYDYAPSRIALFTMTFLKTLMATSITHYNRRRCQCSYF